jgi:hypothetical protein
VIRVPDDGDHPFRADRDQLIENPGTVITMPRNVFHRSGVALDMTEGKLFLLFDLLPGETGANQEIVHAQDQGSSTPPL